MDPLGVLKLIPRAQRKSIYRGFDPLCSSLAVNCCQFSCCIPDVPQVEFPCTEKSSNWMEQLIQVSPDVKLSELVIPGTHDSASYSLHSFKLFSAAGRTQNVSVYEQLIQGARYLDIRVAGDGEENAEDVYVFHGCLKCAKLETILSEIKTFLEEHPQEFIFCEIVAEYGRLFTDAQKLYALKLLKEAFGDQIYTGAKYEELMGEWSLSEVVKNQMKNMCIMVHPRIYKFEVEGTMYEEEQIIEKFGFVNSRRWMRSQWHNTRDMGQLKEWNLDEVKKYGHQTDKKLLNNQIVLTPGVGGPMDIVNLLVGGNSLRPVSFAASLYKNDILDVYFRDNADEPWNMVMLDYIDLTPALVCFLISLNFPSGLTILKAAMNGGSGGSKDVTEKVQSFVKRGRVLYLTNIQKDLELENDSGTLTIAYKLGNAEEASVLTVDFDPETEVLLSHFCKNEENAMHTCIKPGEHPDGGCVTGGRICSKEEARSQSGARSILEFNTAENNECVFGIIE